MSPSRIWQNFSDLEIQDVLPNVSGGNDIDLAASDDKKAKLHEVQVRTAKMKVKKQLMWVDEAEYS
jgi:hypothetical protein